MDLPFARGIFGYPAQSRRVGAAMRRPPYVYIPAKGGLHPPFFICCPDCYTLRSAFKCQIDLMSLLSSGN